MTQEIEEIIKKNLPAQVGEVLQARLKLATDLENTNKYLNSSIEKLQLREKELIKEIEVYKKHDERNAALDAREKTLMERERLQEVTELKTKLEEANKRADMVKEFTAGLVRNVEFKKRVFDSSSGPEGRDQYGQIQYATHTVNKEESKTAQ